MCVSFACHCNENIARFMLFDKFLFRAFVKEFTTLKFVSSR